MNPTMKTGYTYTTPAGDHWTKPESELWETVVHTATGTETFLGLRRIDGTRQVASVWRRLQPAVTCAAELGTRVTGPRPQAELRRAPAPTSGRVRSRAARGGPRRSADSARRRTARRRSPAQTRRARGPWLSRHQA